MFFKSNKLFSIGQLAKMHGINKKTLMWYDEVGLLKPALIKSNGYRYYTVAQSFNLEIILMLRELEVPIAKIKDFLLQRTPDQLQQLYTMTLTEVEHKIQRLQSIKEHLSCEQQKLGKLLSLDLSAISIVYQDYDEQLKLLDCDSDATMENLIEAALQLKQERSTDKVDFTISALVPVRDIKLGNFEHYRYAFNTKSTIGDYCKARGYYLRAYYQGSWEGLEQRYQEMLAYAQAQGLSLGEFAYELGINEPFIDSMEQYITQIDIALAAHTPDHKARENDNAN